MRLVAAYSYLTDAGGGSLAANGAKDGPLPARANAELMEQVLTQRELKARRSSKIREIGEALITAGFFSLNAQAKVFGLPRSTAWTILSAKHKGTGLSARIICRMLSSGELPVLVRAKIMEYAEEKAAGMYGGTERQRRRFTAKLTLRGLPFTSSRRGERRMIPTEAGDILHAISQRRDLIDEDDDEA